MANQAALRKALLVLSLQLKAKGWATPSLMLSGDGTVFITQTGIEEAEKMDRPFLVRFPGEHPMVWGFISSIAGAGLIKLIDLIFGWFSRRLPDAPRGPPSPYLHPFDRTPDRGHARL